MEPIDMSLFEENQDSIHQSAADATAGSDATMNRFAHVLTDALKSILQECGIPSKKEIQLFHGYDHEDPEQFIRKLHEHFVQYNICEDQERLRIAVQQLKGDAAKWYEQYDPYQTTFIQFQERLRFRYNSTAVISSGRTKLYGERQRFNESTELFISKKKNLFKRFDPGIHDLVQCNIIVDQLKPEIRSRLRGLVFQNVESLIQVASQIEADVNAMHRGANFNPRSNVGATAVSAQNRSNNTSGNANTTGSPSVVFNRQMATGNNNNTRNQNNPRNTSATTSTPTVPRYPCRYCQGQHYHSQCPQNPYRQNQGNGQAEGLVSDRAIQGPRPNTN